MHGWMENSMANEWNGWIEKRMYEWTVKCGNTCTTHWDRQVTAYLSVDDLVDCEEVASSHRLSIHHSIHLSIHNFRTSTFTAVAAKRLCNLWSVTFNTQSKKPINHHHQLQQHHVRTCACGFVPAHTNDLTMFSNVVPLRAWDGWVCVHEYTYMYASRWLYLGIYYYYVGMSNAHIYIYLHVRMYTILHMYVHMSILTLNIWEF